MKKQLCDFHWFIMEWLYWYGEKHWWKLFYNARRTSWSQQPLTNTCGHVKWWSRIYFSRYSMHEGKSPTNAYLWPKIYLCTTEYDGDKLNQKPAKIIIDNEAAICMAKCNKDTAGNRHVARRFHYVRQGTVLKEHEFEWISSKFQLADSGWCGGSITIYFQRWRDLPHTTSADPELSE